MAVAEIQLEMPAAVQHGQAPIIITEGTKRLRRDTVGLFHYVEGSITPEVLNARDNNTDPSSYGELDDPKHLPVHDVTGREAEFTLDGAGFTYVSHKSAVLEARDGMTMTEEEIEEMYYPETAALLKSITGASIVHVFNHLRRVSHADKPQILGARDKVHNQAYRVHVDQSWKQVREHTVTAFGEEKGPEMMKMRFQIINIWRPVRPVFKDPLAVSDIRTVSPSDLVRIDVVLKDGARTSNLAVRHSPSHAWYYKHAQKPDEPLLFKQFDSGDRHCLGQILHSAFADEAYEGCEPRCSLEARALVFYEDQKGIQPEEITDRGFGVEVGGA